MKPRGSAFLDSRAFRASVPAALGIGIGLVLVLATSVARADILPEGMHPIKVAVTFEAPTDGHVVAYPIDCMGLDTKQNPSLEYFQNYDVVEPNTPRAPYKSCGDKTKVWILDTSAFKKVAGEKVPAFVRSEWKLEELSKIKVDDRQLFFTKNQNVHATGFAMPAVGMVNDDNPLTEVAETVAFGGIPARVQNVRLVYKYKDGEQEAHTYTVGSRPQPRRTAARDWMGGLVDKGDAGADSDAGAATPPPNPKDFHLDRSMFVKRKKLEAPPAEAELVPHKRRLSPANKLMLGFGLVALIASIFALREDKKKK